MSELRGNGVAVLGVGAVTPLGRELGEIVRRLDNAPGGGPRRVGDEVLADASLSRNLRRADRFTRMAVMAASDAWKAAAKSLEGVAPERVGIILSSGLGPHCRGFKFLDGMLDEGDSAASPTDFSHSVHGAACAYITALLDVRGPSLTLTDFEEGFEQAILLARTWLEQGPCDRVLLGAVEELGEVLLHCAGRILGEGAVVPLGEGAVFLVLGAEAAAEQTGAVKVEGISRVDMKAILESGSEGATKFGYSSGWSAMEWLGEYLRSGT